MAITVPAAEQISNDFCRLKIFKNPQTPSAFSKLFSKLTDKFLFVVDAGFFVNA